MSEEKRKSILIVDDEIPNLDILNHILCKEYTVHTAKNGKEAIETAGKYIPDIILLDIIMPEMDGYSVITELKKSEKTKKIPVIFISSLNNAGDEEKGLSLGAVDFITKPFSPAIVKLRIQNLIKMMNQMQEILDKELMEKISGERIKFLMRMNHEMLTPMNTIIGMTKILKASGNLINTNEYLDDIENASASLLELINNLLVVSETNGIMFSFNNSVFSFTTMFQNIIKQINTVMARKQQTLSSNIDPAIPAQLLGDEKRLTQVISNIFSNAIKFTPEKGEIKFQANLLEEKKESILLQIEISDNGIGMSKEQQDNIFNIFGPVSETADNVNNSARLGLAISKRIVETMGGKIWVESEPKKGSKFIFNCKLKRA